MKIFSLSLLLFATTPSFAEAAAKACSCKCVTKNEDGKLENVSAQGIGREAAGETLKKALKNRKCELSPVCEGACAADSQ